MKNNRHKIDAAPETKDDLPIYIHEPELLDGSLLEVDVSQVAEPEDNVRVSCRWISAVRRFFADWTGSYIGTEKLPKRMS